MEITEEQYARIKDSLPVQRGNVPTGHYGTRSTSPHPRERIAQRKIETKNIRVASIPPKKGLRQYTSTLH